MGIALLRPLLIHQGEEQERIGEGIMAGADRMDHRQTIHQGGIGPGHPRANLGQVEGRGDDEAMPDTFGRTIPQLRTTVRMVLGRVPSETHGPAHHPFQQVLDDVALTRSGVIEMDEKHVPAVRDVSGLDLRVASTYALGHAANAPT